MKNVNKSFNKKYLELLSQINETRKKLDELNEKLHFNRQICNHLNIIMVTEQLSKDYNLLDDETLEKIYKGDYHAAFYAKAESYRFNRPICLDCGIIF